MFINADSIADYTAYAKIESRIEEKFGPNKAAYKKGQKEGQKLGIVFNPPVIPGESVNDWFSRALELDKEPQHYWYEDWYQLKWGLVGSFPNPNTKADPPPKFKPLFEFPFFPDWTEVGQFFHGDTGLYGETETIKPFSQRDGTAVLAFDLTLSIKDQVEETKKLLNEIKKNQPKNIKARLPSTPRSRKALCAGLFSRREAPMCICTEI